MSISEYLESLNQRYTLGNATEHSYRGDLEQLLKALIPDVRVTNEPKRQSCGAPDYILTKNEIPVGFIEAKDIGDSDLEVKIKSNNKDWEFFDVEKGIGRIWINEEQYFDNVPLIAWEFYIGGYQPAQKWLKDRRERTIEVEDILHYQKIIVALSETDRLMKEIDKVVIE